MAKDSIDLIIQEISKATENPEIFLTPSSNLSNSYKKLLKTSYDLTKNEEETLRIRDSLPELILENFDLEQIWQQLELQNEGILEKSVLAISKTLASRDRLVFPNTNLTQADTNIYNAQESLETSTNDSDNDTVNDENSVLEDSLASDNDSVVEEKIDKKSSKNNQRSTAVDDDFFKLQEMENFLNVEESKLDNKNNEKDSGNSSESDSEGSIDLFQKESDDDEAAAENAKNPKYKDFFGEEKTESKKTKRNKFLEEEQFEEMTDEIKSSLQLRDERLKRKIEDLEQKALSEKPWQLKGEINADSRPHNSLLEEIVEFDLTSRPAPVITEETTLCLEDIIKQRIKDKTFDSVVRKQKPIETPLEYKKKLVLDQEKSKESLAQIYEKEYLKQQEAVDPNAQEKEDEDPELHKEIKKLMGSLFSKLDALSNFHFTPKPAAPELKIVTNLPAINMEEVAPIASSYAALLAPEEIKRKLRGELLNKAERTDTDKKRERRKKKLKQSIHAQQKKKREESGKTSSKISNKKLMKDKNVSMMEESAGKKVKSSAAFFTQLQEEVQIQIKSKSQIKKSKKQLQYNARKIKL